MDIVIPYKQDNHNGIELKYALRSIEKNLSGYGDVYVVSESPVMNTKHIYFPDVRDRKEFSIKEKILSACYKDISDDFIMWHDDHFILKPSEIKYWYNGLLKDEVNKTRSGYKRTMERTIELFPEGKNFDIHTPIIFNKEKFKETMTYQEEICLKSFYCNSLNIEGEYMTDLKLNRPMSRGEIMAAVQGRTFFSSGPLSIIGEMVEFLDELFPKKSKFEL